MMNDELANGGSSNSSLIIPPSAFPLITLLTDFGTADYFVGAMKGVILSSNPAARLVDITHEIPPQDVCAGAFTLLAVYREFPAGTIHLAVVDPGVGSSRRAILAEAGGHYFVGPDNGLFSHVLRREEGARVFHLTRREFFREPLSNTFHGRDLFAPVAAALSKGVCPEQLGEEVKDYVLIPQTAPKVTGEKTLEASVIHVDRFGNCVTNLTREHIPEDAHARGLSLSVNGHEITSLRSFFAEGGDTTGELFAIFGSAGFLEIAAFRASAADLLGARPGQAVIVKR